MNPILANCLLLICFGCLLLPQSAFTLRIKRSNTLTNVTTATANNNNNTDLPLVSSGLNPKALAGTIKPQAKIVNISEAAVAKATNASATEAVAKKNQQLFEDLQGSDYLTGLIHRPKRRHHNADGSNAAPPYVYFNKLVSPDGKQERKEFQLLGPNVVIESMQHDVNFGGVAPGTIAGDVSGMGGILLLNADNNPSGSIHGMVKPNKHHRKHKSALSLPPFLFMLQQMLQPNINMDMLEAPMPHSRIDAPFIQFLDSAVDNAMRNNNRDIFDPERDIELNEKDKEKDDFLPEQKSDGELKKKEQVPNRKDDEVVLSCPIHHEHHANNNGEIVDDDVVLVNECHII